MHDFPIRFENLKENLDVEELGNKLEGAWEPSRVAPLPRLPSLNARRCDNPQVRRGTLMTSVHATDCPA